MRAKKNEGQTVRRKEKEKSQVGGWKARMEERRVGNCYSYQLLNSKLQSTEP